VRSTLSHAATELLKEKKNEFYLILESTWESIIVLLKEYDIFVLELNGD
jgi:hypothetical protein